MQPQTPTIDSCTFSETSLLRQRVSTSGFMWKLYGFWCNENNSKCTNIPFGAASFTVGKWWLALKIREVITLNFWEKMKRRKKVIYFSAGQYSPLRWDWEGFSFPNDEDTWKFVSIIWDAIPHCSLISVVYKMLEKQAPCKINLLSNTYAYNR